MDISSTQRLAAYTNELGIERTRATGASRLDPARSAAGASANLNPGAGASGVQVSLSASAQALSESAIQSSETTRRDPSPEARQVTETANRSPRSNRSLAFEAYQKNASVVPGSRLQTVA